MEEHGKPYMRKKLNLGVKRDFQVWLLIRILGVVLVSTLVAVLILYFFARQEIASNFYSAHIQIRRVSDLLWPVMGAGALVSLLGGMFLAVFLPQKIAGPIYRVQKRLKEMGDGDFTGHLVLRRKDTLQDLADSVNDVTVGLRERIQEIKEIHEELDKLIASLGHREAEVLSARKKDALDNLRTMILNEQEKLTSMEEVSRDTARMTKEEADNEPFER